VLVHSELSEQWLRNETTAKIAESAFGQGKSLLLTKYLEDSVADESTTWYEADVESLLSVAEELLLRSLPVAVRLESPVSAQPLLTRSVWAISTALFRIETATACIATNVLPGRARFHRLLMQWLSHHVSSGSSHPLSLQLVLTVIQGHVAALCEVVDDAGVPLLTLTVKLLFDVRTATTLRRNIASLLSRLLRNVTVRERLQELLCSEYLAFERSFVPPNKQDKKRKRTAAKNHRYDTNDLAVILSVLSKVQIRVVACETFAAMNLDRRLSTTAIQSVAMRAALSNDLSGRAYIDLVKGFLQIWKRHGHQEQLTFLAVAVLQQSYRRCNNVDSGLSDQEMEVTCQCLRACTDHTLLDVARGDSLFLLAPVFAAIRVLGVVGGKLLPTTPKQLLKALAQCFHAAMSCLSWPVRAHAMTSLVQFASTLPSMHKDVLPLCLPAAMQKLLQCRLQGSVRGKVDSLPLLQSRCTVTLLGLRASRRGRGSSIFPVASSFIVPSGSYFMTMPTHDGRKAVVIFPPGEKSLEDIRHMLGNDDDGADAKLDIQTLHHVSALPDGGCKLRLQQQ
jgi:hypothetical protein